MIKIGIAAHSEILSEEHLSVAKKFVSVLSSCLRERGVEGDAFLILGGYWGIMKAIVDDAIASGLKVALLPPAEKDDDASYPAKALVIRTGLSMRGRSVALARSSNILVALGGSAGTIFEIIAAYTEGVPVFALTGTGLPSDKIVHFAPHVDGRKLSEIRLFSTPEELALAVCVYAGTLKREA